MVLILCIGDFHVPHRAPVFPAKFKSLLAPGKLHYIFCTGNLCSKEMEDYLYGLCNDVYIARGDMDEAQNQDVHAVNVGSISIGVCHGHHILPWNDVTSLQAFQRDLGVDVLITGNTHRLHISENASGGILVNPGTATGAPLVTDGGAPPKPSFVLMDVQGMTVTMYSYVLMDKENVKVTRQTLHVR